ncbi:hypothetical protein Q428_07705 [Fervidicella metallireducens AeB]|uniref:Cell shape-determining protein MreC n=1 Tax=Fervidicella metallireducens AeB TaxID=1403537 RepID=A0A017RVN6_9CLOT|nr:rod shape-determining protein MreC [Fervidicella metallireducens]EYE88459.1 hypothetical protein Q428_07705 [Fervidicella metallireducens AeB]
MDFLKNKLLTIVLVLCLAFTIFVGVTANRNGNTGLFQNMITTIVTPAQKYAYIAGQRISNIYYFIASITNTRKENIELKKEIEMLNEKIVDYDKLKRENSELSELIRFKNSNINLKSIGANVIGRVGENWFQIILIDVGSVDGVKKGQYVVTGQGLVGRILEVNKTSSKVLTIFDDKINLPARISSTGEDGLINGFSSSNGTEKLCKMNFLPEDTKAKLDDVVVTSDIIVDESDFTVPNILIGKVQKIEEGKSNLEKVAIIKPYVDLSKVQKVMVILK